MKKILSLFLALFFCVLIFSGCENKDENIIYPLPATVDIKNLDDCTIAVSFEKGDIYLGSNGQMRMDLTVYSHDVYNLEDISSLKEGDYIVRLGKKTKIDEIEYLQTGLVNINGGDFKGGFSLCSFDDGRYYELGPNDLMVYYELGEVTLPVSEKFKYVDASGINEEKEYVFHDFLSENAGIDYRFKPNNTKIKIENGYVVRMDRCYNP